MIKIIIFAIVGLFIYKLVGGKLPSLGKSAEDKKLDEDTLLECEQCNTYVTVKESVIVNGKYYCSIECANK